MDFYGIIKNLLVLLLALYLWVMDGLIWVSRAIRGILAEFDLIQALERRIALMGPYQSLGLFVFVAIPAGLVKIAVLVLLGLGHYSSAMILLISAKITFTVVLAWMYRVCRPALFQFRWFRLGEGWVLDLRDRAYSYVQSLSAYQTVLRLRKWVRTEVKIVMIQTRNWINS